MQQAKRVSRVERLVALTLAKNIKECDVPYVRTSNDGLDAYNTEGPPILHSEKRPHSECWLLWSVIPEDTDDGDDDDSSDFETTPTIQSRPNQKL